jgi:hypothetical protein
VAEAAGPIVQNHADKQLVQHDSETGLLPETVAAELVGTIEMLIVAEQSAAVVVAAEQLVHWQQQLAASHHPAVSLQQGPLP